MNYACSMYLLTVPPGTNSSIVMSDGDSAEWTEERSKLNLKDVCQAPLKLSSLQKHLHHKHRREVERKRKGSYTAELNSSCNAEQQIRVWRTYSAVRQKPFSSVFAEEARAYRGRENRSLPLCMNFHLLANGLVQASTELNCYRH